MLKITKVFDLQAMCIVEALKDLTPYVEIKASSRQAMIGSLTDGSTETFWESGDEDRNKTKSLTITCAHGHHAKLICVHIDNCRDLAVIYYNVKQMKNTLFHVNLFQNKVSSISFFCGSNSEELVKLRSVEVETRLLGGWVSCPIQGNTNKLLKKNTHK